MAQFIFKTKKEVPESNKQQKIPAHYFVIGRLFLCLPDYKAKVALIGCPLSFLPDTDCTLRCDWLILFIFKRRTVWRGGLISPL